MLNYSLFGAVLRGTGGRTRTDREITLRQILNLMPRPFGYTRIIFASWETRTLKTLNTYLEAGTGFEPVIFWLWAKRDRPNFSNLLTNLAESVGIEPTQRLRIDRLAICCINHSTNSPNLLSPNLGSNQGPTENSPLLYRLSYRGISGSTARDRT